TRLCGWLFAGRAGLLDCFSAFRLARIVYRRHVAGISRHLHSRACSGVAGVETPTYSTQTETEDVDLSQATWCAVHLCRIAHDRIQLHVARHAGSVSDVSRKTARLWCEREIDDQYCLCDRRDLRRCSDGLSFATMGTSARHYSVGDLRNAAHSTL